ncbi:MAG: CPBP family intramembrane metalloprotease [Candidatus Bathyarchaeota archaeon]|nr:CPBP family intramembrane metalloprotease [Candidatus Bathyarchaeota archaeon]
MDSWFQRQKAKFDPDTLKPRDTNLKTTPIRDIILALVLALIIIAGEFTSRRIVSVLLPTYFNYFFMDLVCLGGFYAVLCLIAYLLIGGDVRQKTGYTGFNINDWYQRVTFYNAALAVVIGIQVVNRFDVLFFSGYNWNPQLYEFIQTTFNTTIYTNTPLYAEHYKIAVSIVFILVNGLWVPIAEEFLWRGIIQTKLSYYMNPWTAITIVSILFSAKHCVVDLVLTRLLFLISFGLTVGWAKQRTNTGISTTTHIYINLIGTIYWIISHYMV